MRNASSTTPMKDAPCLPPIKGEWQTPTKARVQAMYQDAHMRQTLISELTGVPKSTVNRWVHESTSRHVGKDRAGRPRRLSKRDIRLLIFNIRKGHYGRTLS